MLFLRTAKPGEIEKCFQPVTYELIPMAPAAPPDGRLA